MYTHNKGTDFNVPIFTKLTNAFTALGADLLNQISSKSDNKYGKYGQKFFNALKYGFHFTYFHKLKISH